MVNGIECLTKLNKFHNRWQTVVFYSFEDSSQCQSLRNGRSILAKAILIVQYRRHGSIIESMQLSNILLFTLATTDVKLIPLQFPVSLKLRDLGIDFKLRTANWFYFSPIISSLLAKKKMSSISGIMPSSLGALHSLICYLAFCNSSIVNSVSYYFNVMQNRVNVTQQCGFSGGSQQVLEMLIPLFFLSSGVFPTIFQTLLLYDWLLYYLFSKPCWGQLL